MVHKSTLHPYKHSINIISIFPNPAGLFSSEGRLLRKVSPLFSILSCPQGALSPTATSGLSHPANTDLSSAKRRLWFSRPALCHIPHSLEVSHPCGEPLSASIYRWMGTLDRG